MHKILKNIIEMDDYSVQKLSSQEGSRLPKEYKKVNYIESTGSQYIDLKIVPNQDTGFYIDFAPENNPASSNAPSYINAGGAGGNSYDRMGINVYSINPSMTGELQFFNTKKDPKITKNERATISVIEKIITYPDGTTEEAVTGKTMEATNSLIIFASHTTPIERFSMMKLYNFRVYNKQEVIMDLIPCYRKADNEPGLYDIVNDTFYANEGTGSFIYE